MKLIAFTVSLCSISVGMACTDFRIMAKDNSVLVARSMEYATDLKSNIRSSNRGRIYAPVLDNGSPAMTWKAKYGYVFLDGLNIDIALDGINEKGLSFEALYLPKLAEYQTMPAGQEKTTLPYYLIGDWILSSFDSVDEVRQSLINISLVSQKIPGVDDKIFPLHFSIYEASGKGIVVEYVAGKLNIYDNQIAVLTNSPSYPWHLLNLSNYIHLNPQNPDPVINSGLTFAALGQGFGMVGLPGDATPPSRFVKIATLLRVALPIDNAGSAINLAEHIMNSVDIPRGLVKITEKDGTSNYETAQWTVFKDLTHKILSYRTYNDPSLHAIVLDKLDFSENATRLKMPIASNEFIQDMTLQLQQNRPTN